MHQRRLLDISIGIGLFLLISGFVFTPHSYAEEEPDSTYEYRVALKSKESTRIRRLGEMTPDRAITPPTHADSLPFSTTVGGRVIFLNETYARLVSVSSSEELHQALADAQPGDFISLEDGIYRGNFVIAVSGDDDAPIALHGSRRAILEGPFLDQGYVIHLRASNWLLDGFSIRNGSKGIVTDGTHNTVFQGLEIYRIGDEAVHFRSGSTNNTLQRSWIHDTGLINPKFGEGVYIGSSVTNWPQFSGSGSQPDRSDNNRVFSNLIGPNITAEAVDIKEGTTGGTVANNTFITNRQLAADSWVDVKGNAYHVHDNRGLRDSSVTWRTAVDEVILLPGWAKDNVIANNADYPTEETILSPYFVIDPILGETHLILPPRPLPYTLSELMARFPESVQHTGPQTVLLWDSIFGGYGSTFRITTADTQQIHLLSWPDKHVHITGYFNDTRIQGTDAQPIDIQSWNPAAGTVDEDYTDGRSYILQVGGRMDIHYASFAYLGYEEGSVSGVAWRGNDYRGEEIVSRGDVTYSHFMHNYFGAYTWESIDMRWYRNVFAENIGYGFDPHDFSNDFVVEENAAYNNGSHGIIFSRGCEGNIIRNNESHDNAGHGIMLDDGKTIFLSPNPRYVKAVPSNHNIIENNRIWNNNDGIVLEGGSDNIIRGNQITGPHRYGIRLKDEVSAALITENTIQDSIRYGIFIYANSNDNQIIHNAFESIRGGIALENVNGNSFRNNTFYRIDTSAIVFKQTVTNTEIADNIFAGQGTHAIRLDSGATADIDAIMELNDFSQWKFPPPPILQHIGISLWVFIFSLPLLVRVIRQLRKNNENPRSSQSQPVPRAHFIREKHPKKNHIA